jgi:hypothetical protein
MQGMEMGINLVVHLLREGQSLFLCIVETYIGQYLTTSIDDS